MLMIYIRTTKPSKLKHRSFGKQMVGTFFAIRTQIFLFDFSAGTDLVKY